MVVGLGANLGDRLGHLRSAVVDLASVVDVARRSYVYETAPVGPPQPDYLNAAVLVRTGESPEELLEVLMAIERRHGRERSPGLRWEARTLDLDVLWIDGLALATPLLTVPHARLLERPFALRPLLDVAPDAVDPRTGQRFPEPAAEPGLRRTDLVL